MCNWYFYSSDCLFFSLSVSPSVKKKSITIKVSLLTCKRSRGKCADKKCQESQNLFLGVLKDWSSSSTCWTWILPVFTNRSSNNNEAIKEKCSSSSSGLIQGLCLQTRTKELKMCLNNKKAAFIFNGLDGFKPKRKDLKINIQKSIGIRWNKDLQWERQHGKHLGTARLF